MNLNYLGQGDTVTTPILTSIPAMMAATMEELLATKYPAPDWVRQGPNFVKNTRTGAVVNLNQEAMKIIEAKQAEIKAKPGGGQLSFRVEDFHSEAPKISLAPNIESSPASGGMGKVLPILLAVGAAWALTKG
jgi:hypothetical protein